MSKMTTLLIAAISLTLQLSAKEVFILVDTSTKINHKATNESLIEILNFKKKTLEKNFLKYDDTIGTFFMTGDAEDLTMKPFHNFKLSESKKSRKNLLKKSKSLLTSIKKLSGNEIPKIITVPTADIVFCMDASGSMMANGGSNYKQAKEIALKLIDSIKSKKTRMSLVAFNDESKVYQGFTSDKNSLTKSFEKIYINGTTNATSGLEKSYSLLQNSNAKIKKIIFLSDGAPNDSTKTLEISKKINDAKIDLITVALKGADIPFLDQVSSSKVTLNADNISLDTIQETIKGIPSPILESIYYMSNQWTPDIQDRRLVIFSSMMQKSNEYNFYTEKDVSNESTIKNIIDNLKERGLLPNLEGTSVYIQGLSKKIGPLKNSEIKVFWEEYFKASGATLKSWAPSSLNLKL